MILNLVQNGPFIWPTITDEDGTTRTKKYEELSATEKIQAECDCKATNIVLQGLSSDVYAIVNHHKVAKEIWDKFKLLMQGTKLSLQKRNVSCLVVLMFDQGDDLIACLNKAMAFLTVVASSRVVKCYNCQGEGYMARQCTQPKRTMNAAWFKEKAMLAKAQEAIQILDEEQLAFIADPGIPGGQAIHTTIPSNVAFQTEDLDAYDSECDDVSNAKVVLMANLSSYGSDVLSEVPYSEIYHNDMDNQSLHAMQDVPSSSSLVNDRNDQVAKIMGYGDYQLGNVIISRNDIVERQNQTLVEAACTMLIFSKAPLRTQKIMETIHVTFDELIAMASEQFGSGLGLHLKIPITTSSGLVPNSIPQQLCNPPNRDDWDRLFQPMFNEYFNPPTITVSLVPVATAPRAVVTTESLGSTSIDMDAP
nr:hypothetical protein [Tanacetum cinerariifolium]